MIVGKKGALGEGVIDIYRLLVVTIIAVVILGLSAVFYQYYVDVRESEATIFSRQIFDCISSSGVVDLDSVLASKDLLSYCGLEGINEVYIVLEFYNSSGGELAKFEEGDSSIRSIYSFFAATSSESTEKIKKYEPGHVFMGSHPQNTYGPLRIIHNKKEIEGGMLLDVYSKGDQ